MPWKVSVAPLIKREPELLVCRRIQRPPICKTFHQVRIAYEGPAKGDQVRMVVADRSFRCFLSVTAIAYERALKYISGFRQRHRCSESVKAEGEAIYDVEICEAMGVKLF